MKITLDRAPLLAALGRAKTVVERRNTIPILANVLITPAAGALTLVATDLDIEIRQSIPAEIASPSEGFTLPAHTLHEIVRKLPEGGQISIEVAPDAQGNIKATLKAGRSRFALPILPASEFPDLAGVSNGVDIVLPGKDFAAAIARAEFAISTEETRYYLNGIYLHWHGETSMLRLVATDGHRLSLVGMAGPAVPAQMPGVIIPRKAVGELKSMATAADKADIALCVSTAKLSATFGGVHLTTKLIDGTFPDYARVIPTANQHTARLKADELLAAVDRVGTVASERGRAVKFTFSDSGLVLSVENPDAGNAQEEVDCAYAGPEISIGFNGRYLADVLGSIGKEGDIDIALADPGSPALIRRPDETDALCVLMPMRV